MRKEAGFTLMELLIVIGLIVTVTGFAIPGIINWLPNYRLRSAAQDLLSNFQKAKLEAVKRNINTAVTFGTNGYTVFVDSDNDFVLDAGETTVTTVNWAQYPSISVASNTIDASGGQSCIAFRSNGIPTVKTGAANGTVRLTNSNSKNTEVIVSQAGSVRINAILP